MRLWYATEKGRTCAVVKRSKKLEEEEKWKDLRNVSELFIEDEDNALRSVPPYIAGLRHLRILSIRWAKIKNLVPEMVQLPITHVCLSNNRLNNVSGIEEMTSLVVLNLSNNDITALPPNIGYLRALREFDISGNKLMKIPESIGALRHLRVLNLSSNRLSQLPQSICDLEKLRLLEISMNSINYLPERMGNMKGLTELYASDNKINSFPPSMQSCAELRFLHMRKNNLVEIPKMLRHLPYLEVMNFRQNNLTDFRCAIASLKSLLMDTNDFKIIPDAVFKCHNLEFLSMEDNMLKEIPKEIKDLRKLRAFYISYNEIQNFPDEMCHLENLKHLIAQGNKVSFLPAEFYCLQNLTVLNLEEMDLEPEIFQAYRSGVDALMEHMRNKARGSVVAYDPKKAAVDKDYSVAGSKTAVMVRNSTPRSSAQGDPRMNVRGRYAYGTNEITNPLARHSTMDKQDKRASTASVDSSKNRHSGVWNSTDSIPGSMPGISRSRPGSQRQAPEVHPGHSGHFDELMTTKRRSSKKKKEQG